MGASSRASSSVIGTVLLVAVVVVIGSTTAVFALGFADTSREPLQVTLTGEQHNLAGDDETAAEAVYTVETGEAIDSSQIRVVVNGSKASEIGVPVVFSDQSLSAGDTITIQQNDPTDLIGTETVRLIYVAPNTDETKLLETMTVKTGGPAKQLPEFNFEGFSTGSPPGRPWTNQQGAGGPSTLKVTDSTASEGNKSVYFRAEDGGAFSISTEVDLTHVATIKFEHNHAGGEADDFFFRIDGTTILQGDPGGWETYSADVSDYSGTHTITFRVKEDTADAATSHYLDNVRFVHESGNLVSEGLLLK